MDYQQLLEHGLVMPGVRIVEDQERGANRFVTGSVEVEGKTFELEFLIPEKSPNRRYILKVRDRAGNILWSSLADRGNCSAELFHLQFEGDLYYVIGQYNRKELLEVTPITTLHGTTKSSVGDVVIRIGDSKQRKKIIALKTLLAKELEMEPVFTDVEQKYLAAKQKIEAARQEQERLRQEEARKERLRILMEERDRKLQEQRKLILSRPMIRVYGEDRLRYLGIPVAVEEDWMFLEDETKVVIVKDYDDEAKTPGEPVSCFIVNKASLPKILRANLIEPVFLTPPAPPKPEQLIKDILYFEIDGELEEVPWVSSEQLAQIRQQGVNGNSLFAVGKEVDGKYTIVRVIGKECPTIGMFEPISLD